MPICAECCLCFVTGLFAVMVDADVRRFRAANTNSSCPVVSVLLDAHFWRCFVGGSLSTPRFVRSSPPQQEQACRFVQLLPLLAILCRIDSTIRCRIDSTAQDLSVPPQSVAARSKLLRSRHRSVPSAADASLVFDADFVQETFSTLPLLVLLADAFSSSKPFRFRTLGLC
jgi:hypothetical protein